MCANCVSLRLVLEGEIARTQRLKVDLSRVANVMVRVAPLHLFELIKCALEPILNLLLLNRVLEHTDLVNVAEPFNLRK